MEAQPPSNQDELRGALEDAFEHIDWAALRPIVIELAAKSDRFRATLGDPATAGGLTLSDLEPVFDDVFVVRRHRDEFFQPANRNRLPSAVAHLLHGEGGPDRRIGDFIGRLQKTKPGLSIELATDLLHFFAPDRYWLWTRWLYDPEAHSGILPVLLEGDHELDRPSIAEGYLAVGRAISLVSEVEDTRWLFSGGLTTDPQHRSFVADVFLAAAWGSYLYGVTAWRLTREFHKLLPPLPRLVRRLFGLARSTSPPAPETRPGGDKPLPYGEEAPTALDGARPVSRPEGARWGTRCPPNPGEGPPDRSGGDADEGARRVPTGCGHPVPARKSAVSGAAGEKPGALGRAAARSATRPQRDPSKPAGT